MIFAKEIAGGGMRLGHRAAWTAGAPGGRVLFKTRPAAVGCHATGGYVDMMREAAAGPDGRMLFAFDAADLERRGALVALAFDAGEGSAPIAGLHLSRDPGTGETWLRGAFVRDARRGRPWRLLIALGALALAFARWRGWAFDEVHAAVIIRDGVPNAASVAGFGRLGFDLTEAGGVTRLVGDHRDGHLVAGAEMIEGRPATRYCRMLLPNARVDAAIRAFERWGGPGR